MANYSANDRSERILQGRRFTTDALGLSQEAYTSVLDISSYEIYTDDGLIPSASSQLPYSGSTQGGLIVSASQVDPDNYTEGVNDLAILKYYYRHRLKRGGPQNPPEEQVFFFTEEEATTSGGGQFVSDNQLIESDQLTNFISPKYLAIAGDTVNETETGNPGGAGYKVVVYVSDSTTASGITEDAADPTTYVFDYKTGVLSWKTGSTPASSKHVYMTAYRYVGRTLRSQIDDGSIGGGSDFTAADISGSTRIYISGSNGGFELSNDSTLKFISGTAGVTVLSNGSDTITIGANTDNVNFNDISASGDIVLTSTSKITSTADNFNATGNVTLGTVDLKGVSGYDISGNTLSGSGLLIGAGEDDIVDYALIQLGQNYIYGSTYTQHTDGTSVFRTGINMFISGSPQGNQGLSLFTPGTTGLTPFANIAYNNFSIQGTDDADIGLVRTALELTNSAFNIYSGSGTNTVFTVSRQTKAATFAGEVTATGGFVGDLVGDLTGTASFSEKVVINEVLPTNTPRPIIISQLGTPNGQLGYTSGSDFAAFTYNTANAELAINGNNAVDRLTLSTSSLSVQSGITNYDILNTNATTLNFGGAATTINMGAANGTVNIAGSASIAGDLTVQGTVTSIQTENLNVSDQFILLASGSTGTKDGGIIVQSGSNGVGTALYFDANANRWAVNPANSVNWNDTSLTPKQYVVSVSASAASPTSTPQDFGDTGEYYGMMHVNTDNGEIWIYS